MPIIGERLNKIFAERKKLEAKMTVGVRPQVKEIIKEEMSVGGEKKAGAIIKFLFAVEFGKAAGKIEVEGDIFYADKKEAVDKLAKDWKDKKTITDEKLRLEVMNRILQVGYLQAIAMADQVRLPPPIQMPKFVTKKK